MLIAWSTKARSSLLVTALVGGGMGIFAVNCGFGGGASGGSAGSTGNAGSGSGQAGSNGSAGSGNNSAGSNGSAGSNSSGEAGTVGSAGSGSAGTGSAGTVGSAGTGAAGAGPATAGASGGFLNYELTGTMPGLTSPIATKHGSFTYTKVVVNEQFYAESCSIADYNHDGNPDISAGRRWYEGPTFAKVHIFRGGHDALPRAGASEELVQGVSDDWADYPFDMDGDGWADIINIASADAEESNSLKPKPQQHATAYWYKNPANLPALSADPGAISGQSWVATLMHSDVRQEQHGLVDVNGDGKPEIYGACRDCTPTQTKGYYYGDWNNPTAAWKYQAVTPKDMYPFPFDGPYGKTGWLHGLGFGDVNGDGKADLLERGGAWLQKSDGSFPGASSTTTACTATPSSCNWAKSPFWNGDNGGNQGGSHMYAFDIDGDGDNDVFSADWAHGEGLAWYEQTGAKEAPTFVKHWIMKGAGDIGNYAKIYFTEPHAAQAVDMNGDGIPDIVTGKMRFAHPLDQHDPDPHGDPVLYVLETVRDGATPASGMAHFVAHMADPSPTGPEGATGMAGRIGVGRQIAVGHINMDGIPDICVSDKLGLYVFLGKP
jgi:hypothetical protein